METREEAFAQVLAMKGKKNVRSIGKYFPRDSELIPENTQTVEKWVQIWMLMAKFNKD